MLTVTKQEFSEWRNNQFTQALLEDIALTATEISAAILNDSNYDRDKLQHQKGQLQGLSVVAAWMPEFTEEGVDSAES